jgi:hypothetical protein
MQTQPVLSHPFELGFKEAARIRMEALTQNNELGKNEKKVFACNMCTSSRIMEFAGEICLHFGGGTESLNKPLIWAFPRVVVCLECGSAGFRLLESELSQCQQHA